MPTLSTTELINLKQTRARALSVDEVNQLGRDTGQAKRLRTVTPHRLLLADRGYPERGLLRGGRRARGRLYRAPHAQLRSVDSDRVGRGAAPPVPTRIRLSRFLAQHAGQRVALDVEFHCGPRVVGLPGREASMTRLCTNLPRTPFSRDLVARLYRFRWQIELCFKEWTSSANLHQFDTANAHIAEGLIWASLCAAVLKRFLAHAAQRVGETAMSTRRVAMCAHHILDTLVAALLRGVGLRATLRRGLAYLLANARRVNPDRDHRTGRLRAGLGLAEAA